MFPLRPVLFALLSVALASSAPAASLVSGPWPTSSDLPVEALDHPTLEQRVAELGSGLDAGFRLVVFGDQRALADGEWQAMNALIRAREESAPSSLPLLSVVDTGDIVFTGQHSDQFHMLTGILEPLRAWPYLVTVGNHEVYNNDSEQARRNLVAYLGPSLGEHFDERRMYYRRDVGGVRLLFLDSNDLVYGPDGNRLHVAGLSYRGRAQMRWLDEQLDDDEGVHTTIVLLHHPPVMSSLKHRGQGAKLWSLEYEGRTLPTMLAEAGVDLVLVGHTHTYERFHLTAPGGGSFHLVNLSGRPRNDVLWFGRDDRRARDIRGEEIATLREAGWRDLEGWTIRQVDAMLGDGSNQWAELRLRPGAPVEMEVFHLVDEGRGGTRSDGAVVLD